MSPGPDYDPATWSLGYQTSQFGVGQDPLPASVTANAANGVGPSAYAAMADPPTNLTTAIELALDPNNPAPVITPTQ
jgi:hypothetical protein